MTIIVADVAPGASPHAAIRRAISLTGQVDRDPQHQLPTGHMFTSANRRLLIGLRIVDAPDDGKVTMALTVYTFQLTLTPESNPDEVYRQLIEASRSPRFSAWR